MTSTTEAMKVSVAGFPGDLEDRAGAVDGDEDAAFGVPAEIGAMT